MKMLVISIAALLLAITYPAQSKAFWYLLITAFISALIALVTVL
jgi:hypothetical protein